MIALSELRGLARSVSIYYGNPLRSRAHRSFYRQFIDPGDLCFDVGAHVGNHIRTMLKLGARVVAVEPQPRFQWLLHRFYGDNPEVTLVDKALGATPGEAELYVSSRFPTVTTLSVTSDAVRMSTSGLPVIVAAISAIASPASLKSGVSAAYPASSGVPPRTSRFSTRMTL